MRMWMVPTEYLCRKHLLGEHVEHHMFVGTLKRKLQLDGYVRNNLVEIKRLEERHDTLVAEMLRRGMNHNSPLQEHDISYLPERVQNATVDVQASIDDLIGRCEECRARYEAINADRAEHAEA